ncbi:RNI-like protein [Linnemannia elongata AG-77]|uniref:RNI-like protein n=1 Tax=Linnemannia elongata AG-77 TaxID=1314771 RepID=A0A197JW45_9FUNG|nr:RNI-like protein [Linnemannia elongata AG-77]
MDETQSFRIAGTSDVKNIDVDTVNGQSVIYWEDIEQVFPRVGHICNGSSVVKLVRDSKRARIVPHCIKHYPGVVLDVVLATGANCIHEDSSVATSRLAPTNGQVETPIHAPVDPYRPGTIIDELDISIQASSTATLAGSISGHEIGAKPFADISSAEPHQATTTRGNNTYIQNQFISLAAAIEQARQSGKPLTTEALSSLIASKLTLASMAKSGFERTVISKLEGLYDQGAMTQQIAREVWELQKQMNDRLILIQSKTEAILTQQLELAEYPIPRLFVVLPEEPAKYDPGNWFRTKFRLHFICECGKHTEPNNSKIPHHLHLAKHEGYLVREPTKFFKKYGPFLLLMLELIKFGSSITGHIVPALASLKVVELADSIKQSVETVTAKIDYSLQCIDNQMAKVQASSPGDFIGTEPRAAMTQQDLTNYLSDVEGLEGVELRQLGSFLKTSEEGNLLGGLYRMTTSDGHVKWVCLDHYRTGYQETHTQRLRDVVKIQKGRFDEQLGRITIVLESSFAATEFFDSLHKAKGVIELIVDLSWECTDRDLQVLQEALRRSMISMLRLDLQQFRPSLRSKLSSISTRYEVLYGLLELPNLKSIHIVFPDDLVKLSNFTPKRPPHLHKLSFELVIGVRRFSEKEVRVLAEILKNSSTLITIYLWDNSFGEKGAHALDEALKTTSALTALDYMNISIKRNGAQALTEAFKTNSTLTILDLNFLSVGDEGAQDLAEALKTNSTLTTLNLSCSSVGEKGAQALAEALKTNSTLTALDISTMIGDKGVQALAEALKTNSTLTTLSCGANSIGEKGAMAMAETLKTNSTLTSLDLSSISIGVKGAQALAEALKINSTLTTLNLGHRSIGEKGAQALAEALRTNSTLTTLHLHNKIGKKGALAMAEALKSNSTLTTLHVDNSLIGDKGAQALAEALKTNSTLSTLYCGGNSIGDKGTQALAEALKTNSTLAELDLRESLIRDNGAQALSEALKTNSTLITLNLGGNAIGDYGAQALAVAMKTRLTPISLYLFDKSFGDKGAHALSETLKSNSTLTHHYMNHR